MTVTQDPRTTSKIEGALDAATLTAMRERFKAEPTRRIAQNAVTRTSVDHIALNREVVNNTDHTFSTVLDDWKVTSQGQSGRCWAFAGMNLLRVGAKQKMNLKDFEFSQTYVLFWDKLERANYFLQAIIETADRPLDDRTVSFLLDKPLEDGGQWNMFVALVKKHGLVPKPAMPETQSSGATRRMNQILLSILREGARDLRAARAKGASEEALQAEKQRVLEDVYTVLSIHLGTPPEVVQWQWMDRDKKFQRDDPMTPREFAEKYVTVPIDDYVCLVHDPRPDNPPNRTYTVEYLGNVVGGDQVKYLNVDIELMKRIARETIEDGEPVWFGCDVGKMMHRHLGLWDANLYELDALYGVDFTLDKADRLLYHDTLMTHAMLFTGVDVIGGEVRRWRVENSWSEKAGVRGFFTMNDNWFAEHVFEIAAHRDRLPEEVRPALDLEPIVLPAWDPMGALAR
ncbi:MAG TPA: C1 family peptidase [Thermomicrobiales bacterium]|nr:C1 family peptidase [Thermomicrobiales bacterium]